MIFHNTGWYDRQHAQRKAARSCCSRNPSQNKCNWSQYSEDTRNGYRDCSHLSLSWSRYNMQIRFHKSILDSQSYYQSYKPCKVRNLQTLLTQPASYSKESLLRFPNRSSVSRSVTSVKSALCWTEQGSHREVRTEAAECSLLRLAEKIVIRSSCVCIMHMVQFRHSVKQLISEQCFAAK